MPQENNTFNVCNDEHKILKKIKCDGQNLLAIMCNVDSYS